ncbi:hypothetical protein C8A01DRAFT_37429 [Parachaetomium inaequale]|uniref:Metallothionein n=1 Tax=Parachaetomium inaequale TaxID=2588326 RepID=A0AAN6PEJ9_9PEZI|nr:hypothetical protein C8A01DRAFT_37429 [Parachaetomium inaequale]
MTTSTLALLSSLLVAGVQGAAPSASGDISWFDLARNATCTGHADGSISCQLRQVEAPDTAPHKAHLEPQGARPLDLDLEATVLESRAAQADDGKEEKVCSGEGPGKALGCFLNCFGQGSCNAKCDAANACQCSCKDGAGKGEVPCGKKSC